MKLIVGLGNPGKKYLNTRHNVGFMALDKVVEKKRLLPYRLENQFVAEITQTGGIGESMIILSKPQTFMNLSGESVAKIMNYYKIGSDDLIIVYDDIDLPLGTIRIRSQGSSGGHKGLQSIIDKINDNRFTRIRIGIGPKGILSKQTEKYVLEKFSQDEDEILNKILDQIAQLLIKFIKDEFKQETIIVGGRTVADCTTEGVKWENKKLNQKVKTKR